MSDSDANWGKRARHSPDLRDWQVRTLADRPDDQLEILIRELADPLKSSYVYRGPALPTGAAWQCG
jgi:hypothetical protein